VIIGVAAGVLLLAGGLAAYYRAENLLIARWRTLRPSEWNAAIRPARRAFPFSLFTRSRIVRQRTDQWRWTTAAWVRGDARARTLVRLWRGGSVMVVMGVLVIGREAVS
jgi:hypothetical protein